MPQIVLTFLHVVLGFFCSLITMIYRLAQCRSVRLKIGSFPLDLSESSGSRADLPMTAAALDHGTEYRPGFSFVSPCAFN